MSVAAAMAGRADLVTVAPHQKVHEAIKVLAERRIGAVPVIDGDQLLGILSERDLINCLHMEGGAMLDWTVGQVMSPATTVAITTSDLAALALITQRRVRHLAVVDGGVLAGIVSIGDLVKWRLDQIEQEAANMRAYIRGDYEKRI